MRTKFLMTVALVLHATMVVAQSARTRSVQGNAYDSLARVPLAGASVSLVSTDPRAAEIRIARSDAKGHYEIANVPPGTYLLGFAHPVLDSLGIDAPVRRVTLADDGGTPSTRADVGVPGARRIHEAVCGAPKDRNDSSAVLIGHLQDASSGSAAADGRVIAQWSTLGFSRGQLTRDVSTLVATPMPGGWFAFCGLPAETTVALRAASGADSSGLLVMTLPAFGVSRRDIFIGKAERRASRFCGERPPA